MPPTPPPPRPAPTAVASPPPASIGPPRLTPSPPPRPPTPTSPPPPPPPSCPPTAAAPPAPGKYPPPPHLRHLGRPRLWPQQLRRHRPRQAAVAPHLPRALGQPRLRRGRQPRRLLQALPRRHRLLHARRPLPP